MCVIAICEEGLKLDNATFKACFEANSHGAGFAWMEGGELHWSKGHMTSREAWKKYKALYDFPHIAHFRLSSSGGICKELTHPFMITEESPIEMEGHGQNKLLFHNGTVSNWREMLMIMAFNARKYPDGKISDTRVMAMAVSILGDKVLDTSKYVIASPTEFITYGNWEKKDGIYFSNLFFNRSVVSYTNSHRGTWDEYDALTYEDLRSKEHKSKKKDTKTGELPLQLRGQNKQLETPFVRYQKSKKRDTVEEDDTMSVEERLTSSYWSGRRYQS